MAGDEACGLDRLCLLGTVGREALRFGEVRDFPLADLLDLPGTTGEEADLEGMAVADGLLWVVGSHGHMVVQPTLAPGRRGIVVAFDGEVARMRAPLDIRVLDKPLYLLKGTGASGPANGPVAAA